MTMNLIYCLQANCPVAIKGELFDATTRRHVNVGHAGRDTTSMDRTVWQALGGQAGRPRFVSRILHLLQVRIGTTSKALRPAEHF